MVGEAREAPTPTPPSLSPLLQGSVALHDRLQARLDAHLAAFERVARDGPLAVPPAALGAPPTPGAVPTAGDEAAADARLDAHRVAVRAARGRGARARRELASVAAELEAWGDAAALAAVPGAAPARGKENAAADAAAVAAKVASLEALAPRVAAARAAAAAAGGGRPTRAAAGAVEAEVEAARAAAGGATVDDLRRLRGLVAP